MKEALPNLPIIANGGIGCYADAIRCLEETGVDGVMASEGLLDNPKLFSEEGDYLYRTDFARAQLRTAKEFIEIVDSHPNPRTLNVMARAHLFKMLHRFITAPGNRDLLDLLSSGNYAQMCSVVHQLDERLSKVQYCVETAEEKGLLGKTSYYFRHRDERASKRVLSMPKSMVKTILSNEVSS